MVELVDARATWQILRIPAVLLEAIGQIGEDRRTFRQTKSVVLDRRHFSHRIDLREFVGEMLHFSQRDFLRFERDRRHSQEDVQRPARLRHQIVVELQRHLKEENEESLYSLYTLSLK